MSIPSHLRFDKRLIRKNIRDGLVTEAEYEAHLADVEDSVEDFVIIEVPTDPVEEETDGEGDEAEAQA